MDIALHHCIGFRVNGLQLLRSYIFSLGELEDILLTVDDREGS